MKKLLLGLGLLSISIVAFSQQDSDKTKKAEFSVEIDPTTFAFKGFGFHVRMKPKNSDHLLLGVGVYAMDFPSLLVDLNDKNKNQGWNVRLNQGYGAFAEYHFKEVNRKWFVGVELAIQEYKIENDTKIGIEKYQTFLGLGYVGYTIKPFKTNGFYLKPWAGVGYTSKIAGNNSIGNLEYDIAPILFFGALHLGYQF
jgi:hypothetical protein